MSPEKGGGSEDYRAKGRLVVVALAAATMLAAPLALLHSGAATRRRPRTTAPRRPHGDALDRGDARADPARLARTSPRGPATPAELARHARRSATTPSCSGAARRRPPAPRRRRPARRASGRRARRASSAVLRHDHAAAVRHNEALRRRAGAAAAQRRAAARRAPRPLREVGIATWYAWHPGQCASPFLPHGTLLTVTDLATHKTIQCLVTDTEAHNPGRVVDLSQYCFEAARRALPRRDPGPHHLVTLTRSQVSALLATHGLTPSKALGQHFLVDPNTARRIVRLAGVGRGRPGPRGRPGARVAHPRAPRRRAPTVTRRRARPRASRRSSTR